MTRALQISSEPGSEELQLADLIDIGQLQILMEKFTAATGTGTAVLDLEGNVLVATGWQDICTKFHRCHPEMKKRCHESDVALANHLGRGETYNVYRCLNGMVDVAIPITVGGAHIANLFIGQFLSTAPDVEFFRHQAREFGLDEEDYLQALSRVPVVTDEEVKLKADYLAAVASFIGEAGLKEVRFQQMAVHREKTIEDRTQDLKNAQIATLNMMQDVEEARRTAEETNREMKELMTELERSNEELEQFAYVASHDLQEPLRMVSSYTQLLAQRYGDALDDDAKDFINFAVDGANRMQRLIQDLLAYSRVTTRGGEPAPVDAHEALGEAIANLSELISETGALVTNGDLPTVNADRSQLVRLFQNLIHNAIKFRGEAPPRIDVQVHREDSLWEFSVNDNGIGIEPRHFERIFVIFQRLHPVSKFPGTGMGLALCKRIVERHGGTIHVESEPGAGTCFRFTLSATQEDLP